MTIPFPCICGDQQPHIRQHRPAIVIKSRSPSIPTHTKNAVCFLCIFEGLRIPTIRRLSRKPRIICGCPLLTFDPTVFAPSSQKSITEAYMNSLHCQCNVVVDPVRTDVPEVLKKASRDGLPHDRVVIHYVGLGCNPPNSQGIINFFTENHQRFSCVRIDNMLQYCTCPVCLIVDSSNAGVLLPFIKKKENSIAFFACSENETLLISTDAPWDIFSSCLMTPFETALWWHARRNKSMLNFEKKINEEKSYFIRNLLSAILESIAYDTQPQSVFEEFARDPSMLSLMKGFILSQRVLGAFNLHPVSNPEMSDTSNHDLWFFWDTSLDCFLKLDEKVASKMIFDCFIQTFINFPKNCFMPIFSFFIAHYEFRDRAVSVLLNYLDANNDIKEIATRTNVANTIIEMKNPPENCQLLLAKLLSLGGGKSLFQSKWPFWYKKEAPAIQIKAGMLAVCCAISSGFMSSFTEISHICISRAIDCAPYSAILLSLLYERAGRLINLPPFGHKFMPLLDSEEKSSRICTVFLMGKIREKESVGKLIELLQNDEDDVKEQALISLYSISSQWNSEEAKNAIQEASEKAEKRVQEIAKLLVNGQPLEANNLSNLFSTLISSVKANGFVERYFNGIFDSFDN